MAERVKATPNNEFGGAIVIRSPDGMVISQIIVSEKPDTTAFWGYVKSVIEVAVSEHLDSQNPNQAFQRR